MAFTEAEKREIFRSIAEKTRPLQRLNVSKPDYEKSWLRNFAETFGEDIIDEVIWPGIETFEGAINADPLKFGRGVGLSALGGLAPIAFRAISKKGQTVGKATGKVRDFFGPARGFKPNEIGAVGRIEFGRAAKLIERVGGKDIELIGNKINWTTKEGQRRTADLSKRFGPRSLGVSPRQTATNPRQFPKEELEGTVATRYQTPDIGGVSPEELARNAVFYKMGRSAEPTYLGKKVDAGSLKTGEAIIKVVKGKEPEIYAGSGANETLKRFNLSQTGNGAGKKVATEFGSGPSSKLLKLKPGKSYSSKSIPKIDLPGRFRLRDKVGQEPISFYSDFDKAAYNLALSKKPNSDLLAEMVSQSGFNESTILQHGAKIKSRVDKLASSKQPVNLNPRSVTVVGPAKKESWLKTAMGLPSEFAFSIDLPALRQSLRPTLLHPLSSLPAFKNVFKSLGEKGYRETLANLAEESPLYDILETAAALGNKEGKKLFPNIDKLRKLAQSDVSEVFTSSSLGERLPVVGELPKFSKRIYDIYQRTIRAKEAERLVKTLGIDLKTLAKDPSRAGDVKSIVNRVLESTGYGPLGPLEPIADLLSFPLVSPRNLASKVQLYNPLNYVPAKFLPKSIVKAGAGGRYGSGPVYKDFLKDQAKMAAIIGSGLYASHLGGADVETNVLSPNLGVSYGGYRPDIFGGEKAFITTPARMWTKKRVNSLGEEKRADPGFELRHLLRKRLRPSIPSMAVDWFSGRENVMGEDISLPFTFGPDVPYSRWIANQFTPSYLSDIYEANEVAGPLAAAAAVPLGFAGIGSASYDPFTPNPYRRTKKEKSKKKEHTRQRYF